MTRYINGGTSINPKKNHEVFNCVFLNIKYTQLNPLKIKACNTCNTLIGGGKTYLSI